MYSVLQLFKVNRLCGISITANDKQDMASKKPLIPLLQLLLLSVCEYVTPLAFNGTTHLHIIWSEDILVSFWHTLSGVIIAKTVREPLSSPEYKLHKSFFKFLILFFFKWYVFRGLLYKVKKSKLLVTKSLFTTDLSTLHSGLKSLLWSWLLCSF